MVSKYATLNSTTDHTLHSCTTIVVLLPLDALKVKAQTAPEQLKGRGIFGDAIASCIGATASITVAQPLDVIKTRIQNRPFDSPESGGTIFKRLIKNEGMGGLFKGLTPKLIVVGPKLVFSFTVAQQVISYFEHVLE